MIDWRALPARPPSEVEWEELLVKLDIAARAVELAAGDAPEGADLNAVMVRAAAGERWWGERLDDLREGRGFSLHGDRGAAPGASSTREALEALLADRTRNFAKLQRRGLGVWNWQSPLEEGDSITAYQLALLRANEDAELLARLRQLTRS